MLRNFYCYKFGPADGNLAEMLASALANFAKKHPGQQPECILVHPSNLRPAQQITRQPVISNAGCFTREIWLMVPTSTPAPVAPPVIPIQLSF